jgi:hypothetical protein
MSPLRILVPAVIACLQRVRVLSLGSVAGAFGNVELTLAWGKAQLQFNHTPGMSVRDVVDDVCDALSAAGDRGCLDSVLHQILAQELRYFNERDGKNLTWDQRPPRFLSDSDAGAYTQGQAEVLDVYRDDSQTQYYRPYDQPSIEVLIARARSLLPGTNYRDIDALIYDSLANGELSALSGAHVAVIGSVMPWSVFQSQK